MDVGANYDYKGACKFSVWAPKHDRVNLTLMDENQQFEMVKIEKGYWGLTVSGLKPGQKYMYKLSNQEQRPDPASRFQPDGVFGSSAIIDHEAFTWTDNDWDGMDLKDLIFYEIHVGSFTQKGTFKSIIERIKDLADFGVNAVELMPVSQFSGDRNWGYDGVFPFAVQNTYGTPDELKMLVNECHLHGIALFIDFVYNHLGPEGNWLNDYAPYFSIDRATRWGPTINLDGPLSEGVRNYFLENTLYWLRNYHLDGIRLDSILSMHDNSKKHFFQELNEEVETFASQVGKKIYVIAETGFNEPKVLTPIDQGGYGFDAQWLDDFQHALFSLLTGEKEGYYRHYGQLDDLMHVLTDAYCFVGMNNNFRRRRKEESFRWIAAYRFVVFSQNHDQIGNRLLGERLITLAGFEAAKLAAGIMMLSPYVPLLFMGEEHGETAPFLFFTDFLSQELRENILEGRRREFSEFKWKGEIPDPQSLETFEKSKVNWQKRNQGKNAQILAYYRNLLRLRKSIFCSDANRGINLSSFKSQLLFIHKNEVKALVIANFSSQLQRFKFLSEDHQVCKKILDSADSSWGGPGSSMPNVAVSGTENDIQGFSLCVYLAEEKLKEGKV
jgi:maltooligosyltrehalose trehalohydrolase